MQDFKSILRKIGKGLIFILILCAIFTVVTDKMILASAKDDSLVQGRNKSILGIQKETENTIDVLVLGDSLSYSSISPMQLWRNRHRRW